MNLLIKNNMARIAIYGISGLSIRLLLIFLCTLVSVGGQYAVAGTIYITKEEGLAEQEKRLAESFSDQLISQLKGMETGFITATESGFLQGPDNIIVALGEGALRKVLGGTGNSPIIAAFISRSSYYKVMDEKSQQEKDRVTAIFSNPSPRRQIALVKALLGNSASIGVIKSPGVEEDVKAAVVAAEELGVQMQVADIEQFKKPKSVVDALSGARTLLLQKNKELFNFIPLDTLIVLAYDLNSLGIIGYSSGVVKNGALATTYTSLDDTVKSVASVIQKIKATGNMPAPDYSEYYSVILNKYVVRSLDLYQDDDESVKIKISALLEEGK